MKLAVWKRTTLAGLMALTVAGAALPMLTPKPAAADPIPDYTTCYGYRTPSGKGCSIN